MVSHGRVELLAHPLSQKYLQMKWNSYGKYFHVTNLFIYSVFLMFVTFYASELMTSIGKTSPRFTNQSAADVRETETIKQISNYIVINAFLFILNFFLE